MSSLNRNFRPSAKRLEQAVRADVVGAPSRLNASDDFSLKPGQIGQRRHYDEQQDGNLD